MGGGGMSSGGGKFGRSITGVGANEQQQQQRANIQFKQSIED